ncbi:MerR family transcriptional regulator [Clavibacter michiganensis]|uniref:Zinc-responsive transcriptional regulator n=1 Tax=Clavibacter michiganensis TaxID=28447 RepID=A0A251YSM7_9MICO|nr:MerR family transcriptional regulator [Clavibacter michiganensis]OUE27236.1 zinc-responsive transcriptional regulator [Clavibacter michiganensis]
MRITELAEATGVAPATVKYYVREGLLPAGIRVSDNRTDYDEEHARRVRLIRALIDVGRLPVARAREVLATLDDEERHVQDVFAVAQDALTPGPTAADPPPADALARVDAASAEAGWCVIEGHAGRAQAARAVDAFARSGHPMEDAYLARYAEAAAIQAEADLAAVRGRPDRTAMAELMVVGTVLGDQLAAGLRRIAQATASSPAWASTGGAS